MSKKGTKLHLDVHFDPQIITLFKEVRNLQALNFRVPLQIILLASSAKQVYPFAVSLKESVRTYVQVRSQRSFPPPRVIVSLDKRLPRLHSLVLVLEVKWHHWWQPTRRRCKAF